MSGPTIVSPPAFGAHHAAGMQQPAGHVFVGGAPHRAKRPHPIDTWLCRGGPDGHVPFHQSGQGRGGSGCDGKRRKKSPATAVGLALQPDALIPLPPPGEAETAPVGARPAAEAEHAFGRPLVAPGLSPHRGVLEWPANDPESPAGGGGGFPFAHGAREYVPSLSTP